MAEINYDLLINKLTEKGVCKFVSRFEIDGFKCPTKKELKEKIKELTGKNSLFTFIPEKEFLRFYKDTEEAGQKHFFFYRFEQLSNYLNSIEDFKRVCTKEDDREFHTAEDDEWYYYENNDEIVFKLTSIKKVYQHNKYLDEESDTIFKKGYNVFDIHNILFFRFIKSENTLIIGLDKYSDFDTEADIRKKIQDKFRLIVASDEAYGLLEPLIDSDTIENLLTLPNTISVYIKNTVDDRLKSTMKAEKADIERILKDININELYDINEVKRKNPSFDIKAHPTYLAEQEKSIEAKLSTNVDYTMIWWFSRDNYNAKADCFQFKINTDTSSIVTFASSITKQEFEDVIREII
ncbi:MAG: hypothetical protein Q7T91_03705 [Sulfuricurvum sp.]|nr:hypothetical protein [Sulfuricurvum sp.]